MQSVFKEKVACLVEQNYLGHRGIQNQITRLIAPHARSCYWHCLSS